MAHSYVASNIGTKGKDKARFLIGDTGQNLDESNNPIWLLSDEEITPLIAVNFDLGICELCEGLISRFSAEPTKFEDGTQARFEWANKLKGWERLASSRRNLAGAGENAVPPPSIATGVMGTVPGSDKLGV
jgi:hypothetical protein